ncbi:PREDICTED: probable F-box protein At5g47300 [Erythranthe guttata]|uniref:probable F-box protein At5g47300 n=1 Tax=Erythranthe guttata TaxID=4155 RepID=UPI00064DB235|nr:PREDICTED: probable F-box protein At5g47300 [Erythranthe guttata]|eukprot:XP_012843126.1 PREDICTED: probable F-box protein At5g47300 [Erythranthe guttata]
MADDKSDLPPEIIEFILSKLSVKSLLRFKSVSKSWSTMISDPVFVQNQIQKSKESNSHKLFLSGSITSSSIRFSAFKLEDNKFQTLPVVTEAPFGCISVLCFCDDILLLIDSTHQRLVLWNPSTRTAEKLWHKKSCRYAAFGLCRDPNTGDFKVVVVAPYYYSVYSCTNKSWITMTKEYEIENAGLGLKDSHPRGVCVNGASYWVWSFEYVTRIMYYDPRDDKLKMMDTPENTDDTRFIFLVNLRGSLCVYCDFRGLDKNTIRIWEKENGIDNNSWKELISVKYDRVSMYSVLQPLCFIQNKIVFRKDCEKLVIYNPCEKRFEEFDKDSQLLDVAAVPIQYVESLYFPIEKSKPTTKRKCLQ